MPTTLRIVKPYSARNTKKLYLHENVGQWVKSLPGGAYVLLHTLVIICTSDNGDGLQTSCRMLAQETGQSKSMVAKHLATLEGHGLINRLDRESRYDESKIRLCYDRLVAGPRKKKSCTCIQKKRASCPQICLSARSDVVLQPPSELLRSSYVKVNFVNHGRRRAAAVRRGTVRTAAREKLASRMIVSFPKKTGTDNLTVVEPNSSISEITARVAAANAHRTEKLAARRAKRGQGEFSPVKQLQQTWSATVREVHGTSTKPWSGKEMGQAKHLLSWHPDAVEFATFAARHWGRIVSTKFRWMTEKPAPQYPDIGFLIGPGEKIFREEFLLGGRGSGLSGEGQLQRIQRELGINRDGAVAELERRQDAKKPKSEAKPLDPDYLPLHERLRRSMGL